MNIQIKDYVGFNEDEIIQLVHSLITNRKPKDGSFNYGLETHGIFEIYMSDKLPHPIKVWQSNKRISSKSPIVIEKKKHNP